MAMELPQTYKHAVFKESARVINIVKGETLGVDEKRDGEGRRYGAKLEQVIELLKYVRALAYIISLY